MRGSRRKNENAQRGGKDKIKECTKAVRTIFDEVPSGAERTQNEGTLKTHDTNEQRLVYVKFLL